ncbi:MAG: hypothetical protein ACP5VE_12025 [Chthonomonadales bacterium]
MKNLSKSAVSPVAVAIALVVVLAVIAAIAWRMFGPTGPSGVKVVTQKAGEPFAGAKRAYGNPP